MERIEAANRSSFYMSLVRPLLDFIQSQMAFNVAAHSRISFSDDKRKVGCNGMTWQKDPWRPGKSVAYVRLPAREGFKPGSQRHMKETPRVFFKNWEEEVILVIAHELRHVQQYQDPLLRLFTLNDKKAEIDAEMFGIQVLQAWRKAMRKRK